MTFELRNLSIGYREGHHQKVIASNLNATMESGTLICLVGRNGIGKSTLLRTLSGFQPALDGDMLLDGQSILAYTKRELSETISVVLTERTDIENLTVADVVGMGRMPYTNFWGTLRKEDKRVVRESIKAVGMTAFSSRAMSRLSDGERQKVMIAKAIAQQTPLILLDEPTAFLDYPSKTGIVELLLELAHTQKKIIFLSTHDLDVAYRLADSIWLMDEKGLSVSVTSEQLLALNFRPANNRDTSSDMENT
ncbi:MAG: ABC transporter ATP-binding protein [Bacteroidaceae bacterium]|nr:ABC transporter ATP-binding protein [Bacteroidaceae bacterium]